jgi:hypothetical protein
MRTWLVVLAALVVTALPVVPASAATSQGIGIRLLDAPVARKDDPRAQTYVVDQVHPGDALSRRFEVSNGTTRPVTLQLYTAAADIEGDGWRVEDGRGTNELTEWTQVSPSSVSLAPGQSATATLQVRIPKEASQGERYAAVLAELPAPPISSGNVALASRVGIRMYLSVGPGGEPASDFTVSTLTPERDDHGAPAVTAHVTNTGGRALDLAGQLDLSDGPGGLRAGPFDADVRTVGIGKTGDVRIPLDKALPAGPWKGRLVMRSGRVEHAVEATFTFPAAAGAKAAPVRATAVPLTKDPDVLVPIAVGLILLVLAGLLWLLWRRRRRDDRDDDQPAPALPGQRRAADDEVRR